MSAGHRIHVPPGRITVRPGRPAAGAADAGGAGGAADAGGVGGAAGAGGVGGAAGAADAAGHAELDPEGARYLGQVLRLAPGDPVEVFDGAGTAYAAVIEALGPEGGRLRLGARRPAGVPPPFVLLQGLPKGDKLELVIQKATELGATEVRPVACERSVARYDAAKAAKRTERWRRIAAEAARQCGRADVPEVHPPASLAEALAALSSRADLQRLVAWEEAVGTGAGLKARLESRPDAGGHALLVGPEGGLTEGEVEAAQGAGFEAVSLGRRILRTETAALAVLAAIRYVQGELG